MQIWENWYLRLDIYPQAAPIIARLPLGYAQGFTITVQVHSPWGICTLCTSIKLTRAKAADASCQIYAHGFTLTSVGLLTLQMSRALPAGECQGCHAKSATHICTAVPYDDE